jgi:hypothetical protein
MSSVVEVSNGLEVQLTVGSMPHSVPFFVTSVGCCWVVNFPCWVTVPHRPSAGGHTSSSGDLAGSSGNYTGSRLRRSHTHSKKLTDGSSKGFCYCLEHCVATRLLTGSLQLSSADFQLDNFVVWAPTFSTLYLF